jgi:hypothetical protein
MARSQYFSVLNVTTPDLTAIDTPLVTPLDLGDVRLDRLVLRFPPGPSGLVGAAIYASGTQILPFGPPGTWIIGDDEQVPSEYGDEIDQGVTIVTYNLDTFEHTLYWRFYYTPMTLVVGGSQLTPVVAVS